MNRAVLNIRDHPILRVTLRHLKQIAIIASAYFVYMFVRKIIIPDIEPLALANAFRVVSFESLGGFFWEQGWQAWALEHSKALVIAFNWIYIVTFWPILIASAFVVYVMDREKYFYYRNVVLLSFIFALTLFAAFPLAPPRVLPEYGFLDSIIEFGPSWYGGRDMAAYYNAYAAMPSLHFSWTVLFGILFLRSRPLWLKPFGIIYPAMTFFAITVTGNHYVIDAVGGMAVTAASFLLYEAYLRGKLRVPSPVMRATERLGGAVAPRVEGAVSSGKAPAAVALVATRAHFGSDRLWRRMKRRGPFRRVPPLKPNRT